MSPGRGPLRTRLDSIRARLRGAAERRRARRRTGYRLLRAFAREYPEAFFIEIGANDGERDDHLAPFIRRHRWAGVMVEPEPGAFERLRRNYDGVERVALENVAISDHDGSAPFYHLAPLAAGGGDPGIDGGDLFGSLTPTSVAGIAAAFPGLERRVERIEVPCLSFDSLCRKHAVERLDLLVIDAEGYDYEILRQVDFDALRPRVLAFEFCHLSREQRGESTARLESLGYTTMNENLDTWCVDVRPDDELTRCWAELRETGPAVSEDDLRRWFEGVRGRSG